MDFNMARDLRQGDPIAPFLFFIVAEGLADIMRSAVSKKIFKGYSIGRDEVIISHLQYADDTLLIGENSVDNVLVLKSILKCFELTSGLKINFHKSSFICVKSNPGFVQMTVNKLFCGVGSIPFKFLGIHVGANSRRFSTWSPVIEPFKKKLSLWQQKLISFSGRVKVLRSRYGVGTMAMGEVNDVECFKKGSSWWRDLGSLSNRENGIHNEWFNEGVRRRVGCVAMDKDVSISSLGEWRNGVQCWSLNWRRNLFLWEQGEVENLLKFLEDARFVQDLDDGWLWVHDKGGLYSVRNAYKVLQNEVTKIDNGFYKRLWACNVPSKLKCLVWRMSLDRVPTRSNLARHGALGDQAPTGCVFCGMMEESIDHFFTCPSSYSVWQKLYS
ncbi:PREDICTED: uncharacterized protein LOC109339826 [Lupinus angustifolius]|uniref:uncharacterized protein LOC109339826 n=1 Tax=Lupinus angustifolius TaxID=3871 RepID=UPI00092E3F2F|nr:PREDICTED: uncharacterized protein LOC109339826 [Lupinus angustifolius]